MEFGFGQTVFRDRRERVVDEMNPERTVEGDFDPSLTIQLNGAWIASSSSVAPNDATRAQILNQKSLYLTDPTADVQPRDRIRDGGTLVDLDSGTPYIVDVVPQADVNPFTGWQPVKEVPLVSAIG